MQTQAFCSFVTLQTISQLLYRKATRDGSYLVNTAGSMVLAEAIKLGISLGLVYKEKTPLRMPTATALGYVALAVGYAANNQLTFVILRVANPGVLSLCKSATPLLIAALSFFVFKESLTRLKWQCVVLQVCGMASIFSRPVARDEEDDSGRRAPLLIFVACALTAACSSLNAQLLRGGANVHVQNALLYAFGVASNLSIFLFGANPSAHVGLFAGYDSPWAVALLLSNSFVGLLVTFVYKQSNAVVKTLAGNVSSALLVGLPALARPFDLPVLSGCGVILTTTLIYLEDKSRADREGRSPSPLPLLAAAPLGSPPTPGKPLLEA